MIGEPSALPPILFPPDALRVGDTLVNLSAPDLSGITLADVGRSLAGIRRFAGQSRVTVARHSLLVASFVPPGLELPALLHDAEEMFMVDIPAPVAYGIGGGAGIRTIASLSQRLSEAIAARFGVPVWMPRDVAIADRAALVVEALTIWPDDTPEMWGWITPARFPFASPRGAAQWLAWQTHRLDAETDYGDWIMRARGAWPAGRPL